VKRINTRRLALLLAGLWLGLLLGVALVGTPAGFALAPKELAGRLAGHMLTREAYASLALAAVLFFIVRQQAHEAAGARGGSVMSANVLLVLGTLFCTVAGHFALQPMLAAARAGQGAWGFGQLHAVSVGFYGLKTLLVLALAWRLSR
jgi:hypothetical protein